MAIPLTPPLTFGMLLKRHRRLRGLSQEQLAERAGFSVSYISMLERGARAPTAPSAELLAVALDLSLDERVALDAAFHRATAATIERSLVAAQPDGTRGAHEPALPVGGFLGARPDGPLVARAAELRVALAALDAALAGAGRLVTLTGESGIGKTRLAQELALRAGAHGALVATGRCDERQQAIGFAPIGEALGQLYAAAPPSVRAEAARRWPAALALLPEPPPDVPPPPAISLAAQEQGEHLWLLRQVAGLVAAVAATRPVALLLDDLHWADEASLDCLRHLARQTRGAAVLLLGTYRDSEVRHQPALRALLLDLVRERLVERIALRPLAPDETAALVSATLGAPLQAPLDARTVEADLGAAIQRATQGNPLFIQEMARTLAERGEVVLAEGQWRRRAPGPLDELELPESIRGAIGERVARLSPLAHAVLREASVLGPVFAFAPLCALNARGEDDVETALEEALAAAMVHETADGDYTFNHPLTHRAVYAEIPAPTRRRLHRAAGEALERGRPGERARRAAALADHFVRGDAPERALPYIIQAGDQTARVYAQVEADHQYSLAVDLARELGDEEHEAQARERRADVRYLLGRFEEGYADLLHATGSYRTSGNWERLAWATCQMAKMCDALGRAPQTMAFVEDLLDTLAHDAQGHPRHADTKRKPLPEALEARTARACAVLSPHTAARLYLCLLSRLAFLGRYEMAIAFSAPVIARISQAAEPGMLSLAYSFRALAQQEGGFLDDAAATLDEALRTAGGMGEFEARFMALSNLAGIHERRAAPRAAREAWLRALDALTHLDDTWRRVMLLVDLGRNALALGEWAEARARWSEAIALAERADRAYLWVPQGALAYLDRIEGKGGQGPDTFPFAQGTAFLAPGAHNAGPVLYSLQMFTEDHILMGDTTTLWELSDRFGAEYHDAALEPFDKSELAALLAWVALRLDHTDEAERLLAQACERADVRRNRASYTTIWRVEALLALHQGDWARAEAALDRALALCRAMPSPYAEAKTLYVAGQLHHARGAIDAARERYQRARAILNQLGEALYRAEVERALAALDTPR